MSEIKVSGNIYACKDSCSKDGEVYIVRNKHGQGWGIDVSNVTPTDLRVLADRLESIRNQNEAVVQNKLTYQEETMFVLAARYAHNRQTGAALQVVTEILNKWDRISDFTKEQLKREAKEASFNHDDWALLIDKEG